MIYRNDTPNEANMFFDDIFKNKSPNYDKLINFGFVFNDNTYMPITQQPKYYMPIVQRQNKKGYYRPIIMEPEMSDELKNRLEEWLNHVAVEPNQSF